VTQGSFESLKLLYVLEHFILVSSQDVKQVLVASTVSEILLMLEVNGDQNSSQFVTAIVNKFFHPVSTPKLR
jgi:hypothetical protein